MADRSLGRPTPPMSDAERAARLDELKRLMHGITTRDDWCTILSWVGRRAARLANNWENANPGGETR
jgi:hypothetical protein